MQLNLCSEHYISRDTYEPTINLIPEINTSKQVEVLINTPGLDFLAYVADAPVRGFHVVSSNENILYAVFGKGFYKVLADYSFTKIGEIGTDSGLVDIKDNGYQVIIADNSNSTYIYDISANTLTAVTDPNFPGAGSVTYIDTYFVTHDPGTNQIRSSQPYDGTTWDALDVASVEGDPSNIVRVTVNQKKELRIYKAETNEVWYDAALEVGFPFTRMQGGILEYGLAAKWSHSNILGVDYLLAKTDKGERVVVGVYGYQPNVVSHPGINYEIGQIADTADAEAFSYMQDGHSFYVITFPSGDKTLVYDATTGKWHRRKSYDMGRWRARCYAFFNGKHIVGDFQTGNIYALNTETYTENGQPIERIVAAREIIDKEDRKRIFVDEVQLDMDLGLGNDQVENPVAIMQTSLDIGKTWGSEHRQYLMKAGKFKARIVWYRWGKARRRIFQLTITDPVKVVIRGCSIEATQGIS